MPKVVPEYKEEAKNRILQAASKLFIEQGYKKTNMNQLARQLGVSKGAIYQYYGSKEELLMDVMKSSSTFRKSSLFSDLKPDDLNEIGTREFFLKMVRSSEQINKLGVELASQALYNPEMMREFRSFYHEEVDIIADHIKMLKREGRAKRGLDPRVYALSILALRTGLRGFLETENEKTVLDAWRLTTGLLLGDLSPV